LKLDDLGLKRTTDSDIVQYGRVQQIKAIFQQRIAMILLAQGGCNNIRLARVIMHF
jgi:hypothetical protein